MLPVHTVNHACMVLQLYLFWRRKWTGATVLFILNRYIVLLVHIISLCSFVRTTNLVWFYAVFESRFMLMKFRGMRIGFRCLETPHF